MTPTPHNSAGEDGENIPFIAVGNEELGEVVHKNDFVYDCKCGKRHKLKCAKDSNGKETNLLMFWNCRGKSYLGAVDGRRLK